MNSSLWFFFQVYDIPPAQMYVGQHRNQGVYDVPPSQMDARAQGVYDVPPPSQGVRDDFQGCFTHSPKLSQPGLISLTSCPHKFFKIQEERERCYFSE